MKIASHRCSPLNKRDPPSAPTECWTSSAGVKGLYKQTKDRGVTGNSCFQTLDEEAGDAKMSCGQTKPARMKQGRMSVGGWRVTKGKTEGRGITPAEAIFIEQGGFILNKVSNQIKQEPHKNNTNISSVI